MVVQNTGSGGEGKKFFSAETNKRKTRNRGNGARKISHGNTQTAREDILLHGSYGSTWRELS